jgi:hypothetical protein
MSLAASSPIVPAIHSKRLMERMYLAQFALGMPNPFGAGQIREGMAGKPLIVSGI